MIGLKHSHACGARIWGFKTECAVGESTKFTIGVPRIRMRFSFDVRGDVTREVSGVVNPCFRCLYICARICARFIGGAGSGLTSYDRQVIPRKVPCPVSDGYVIKSKRSRAPVAGQPRWVRDPDTRGAQRRCVRLCAVPGHSVTLCACELCGPSDSKLRRNQHGTSSHQSHAAVQSEFGSCGDANTAALEHLLRQVRCQPPSTRPQCTPP